jgi:hypothetical protein
MLGFMGVTLAGMFGTPIFILYLIFVGIRKLFSKKNKQE